LASCIPSSWPSVAILSEITKKSSGQFIFASTTVKYIGGDPYELPTRRLYVIHCLQPPRGEEDLPYAELNSLYHHVLSNVRDIQRVKDVLGVLIVARPLIGQLKPLDTTQSIDNFFLWNAGETRACLSPLESIVGCDRGGRISVFHASLSDFLLDPSRSHQFYLCRESILGHCVALGLRHLCRLEIHGHCVLFSPSQKLIHPVLIRLIFCARLLCLRCHYPRLHSHSLILYPSTPRGTESTVTSRSLGSHGN